MLLSEANIHYRAVEDKRGNIVRKPKQIMRQCSPEASTTDENISLR